MIFLAWIIVSIVALAILVCLMISFIVSLKLTRNHVRKPINESPEDYGLDFELISFQSRDDTSLEGWFIPAQQPKNRTIIFAHGYRGNRLEKKLPALKLAKDLTKNGFHVLLFDFRSCGESSGNVATIGLYEQEDLLSAIAWVKANHPSSIGLIGFSMGASTALLAAARAPEVVGVVADSPFDELSTYLTEKFYVWTKLPSFPFTPLTLAFIRMHVGNAKRVNPRKALKNIHPRPVLFIHGDQDYSIPYENSIRLHEAYKEHSELWTVSNADHVQAYRLDREKYTKRVVQFFGNIK
ncbi:alpha/beta hydrolase [Paenibacillus fonticola]|uniref:alpha/beta hydrolase n=1 Tax=Paenibacillus fonticola TaxID=379896 RepID=UPI000364A288|nr:alpha/beta fold hydrolase [Paenibacillus fonticola]